MKTTRGPKPKTLRLVTAYDFRFANLGEQWKAHAKAAGYRWTAFDLDTFPGEHGLKPDRGIPPCLFKPRVVLELLGRATEDFIVWLDCDAFIQERIDGIAGPWDIAVTQRTRPEIARGKHDPRIGTCNAGVIAFRVCAQVIAFCQHWERQTVALNSDQGALNALLDATRLKVMRFPGGVFNNYYGTGGKIVHHKGARKTSLL